MDELQWIRIYSVCLLKKDNPLIDKSIFNSIHAVSLDTMPGYKTHGKTYSFLDNYYNNERSEEQP